MTSPTEPEGSIEIDLRNPWLAAFLAWLVPGAGHFYQRRYAKGILFFVCILGTFFFGLVLGEGKVVYAQWKKEDRRWQYLCQVGAGLPALPAVVQSYRSPQAFQDGRSHWYVPPHVRQETVEDELAQWHYDLKWKFELATLYTMVAGLLNILAIYDAFAGPFIATPEDPSDPKKEPKGEKPKA